MAAVDTFDFFTEASQFLKTWPTASLATIDENGSPHAANVQFAASDIEHLYFVSSSKSSHSLYVETNPNVAMSIYAHVDTPDQIHGIQLHGRCQAINEGADQDRAWDCYCEAFPFVLTNPMIEQRLRSEQFYVVTPTWMRYIDNRRGFGFKAEHVFEI